MANGKHETSKSWLRARKRDDVMARLLAGLPVEEKKKQEKPVEPKKK
jgi:hypothetical protein